uniref:Hpt domain-containing protein n=1 Tax=Planktothricoides sp. SpSt-374 TaxID=2282167 RepID=A0A7C3VKG1_9CYAN
MAERHSQPDGCVAGSSFQLPLGKELFDPERLADICDGDVQFENEVVQMFLEDAISHFEAALLAVKAGDFQRLGREAHYLKGASANMGAHALEAIALDLEIQSGQNSGYCEQTLISVLVNIIDKLNRSLAEIL